ncbi:laccase domain-containing protein [Patescibacteria group bacterium]|nr:laccase domain-containing protein [Patescibacteria group bacterium]
MTDDWYTGSMHANVKPKPKAKLAPKPKAEPQPAVTILGTTEQADGDWQLLQLEKRLDQLTRMIQLRHRNRPERIVWAQQGHTSKVSRVDDQPTGPIPGDALVTNQTGVLLTVRTADCMPVFFESEKAVGIAHVGMAGAVEGLVPKTVRALKRYYSVKPEKLSVRFGPHICASCYRMSVNNDDYLAKHPEAAKYVTSRGHHRYFSMMDIISEQLAELGVTTMAADSRCTYHSAGLFSARRGHGDQRQLSFIMRASTSPPVDPNA